MKKIIGFTLLVCLFLHFSLPLDAVIGATEVRLLLLPSALEIGPSSRTAVTLVLLGEPGQTIQLSTMQLPAELSATIDPPNLTIPGTAKLHLETTAGFHPGPYTLEISATDGTQVCLASLSLSSRKDLEISVSPTQGVVMPDQSMVFSLYLYHTSPFTQLQLQLQSSPPLEAVFSSLQPLSSETSSCTLSVSPLPPGLHSLEVNLSDGKRSAALSLSIVVMFPDVEGHWSQPMVSDLMGKGILAGYADGTFRPESPLTRAEFAKIVSLTFSFEPKRSDSPLFLDIEKEFWALPFIERLWKAQIIEGFPDNTFRAQEPIKRAELAAMLTRVINWPLVASSFPPTFTDLDSRHWGFQYIETGAWQGAWDGYPNGSFQPDRYASRAEVAALIARLLPD
ncbi:MAG: S-layer homology domain-containing protein [bacterium]